MDTDLQLHARNMMKKLCIITLLFFTAVTASSAATIRCHFTKYHGINLGSPHPDTQEKVYVKDISQFLEIESFDTTSDLNSDTTATLSRKWVSPMPYMFEKKFTPDVQKLYGDWGEMLSISTGGLELQMARGRFYASLIQSPMKGFVSAKEGECTIKD